MNRPAVFIDRDDTLVADPGYIDHPDKVRLLPGAAETVRRFRELGYLVVLVSNQSGVARGLFTEEQLQRVHQRLLELLAAEGATLDDAFYCPFLDGPEAVVEAYRKDSDWRKPRPGMLLAAAERHELDLRRSWMIGDSSRDMEAGRAAGCRTVLVGAAGGNAAAADFVAADLREAVAIVQREASPAGERAVAAAAAVDVARLAPTDVRAARPPRRSRWSWWVIAGMVVVWIVVLLQRNTIRAHWFAYRLERTESPFTRFAMYERLVKLEWAALGPAERLLSSPDPGVRSLALGVLGKLRNERVDVLLRRSCYDEDEEVRRQAIEAVITRHGADNVQHLRSLLAGPQERTAMMTAFALALEGSDESKALIIEGLGEASQPGVQVELIAGCEMLRLQEAVAALIELLGDPGAFEGETEQYRYARRLIEGNRSRLPVEPPDAMTAEFAPPRKQVVGERAAEALERITGQTPPPEMPADPEAMKAFWRDWASRRPATP